MLQNTGAGAKCLIARENTTLQTAGTAQASLESWLGEMFKREYNFPVFLPFKQVQRRAIFSPTSYFLEYARRWREILQMCNAMIGILTSINGG